MVESQTEEEKKRAKELANALKCKLKHKLVLYQSGFKRRIDANGQTIQPRSSEFTCGICTSKFQAGTDGYVSCKSTCDFFLCHRCAICRDCQKIMMKTTGHHRDYQGNNNTWGYCNQCS